MKISFGKKQLKIILVTICYLSTIIATIFSTDMLRYLMYFFIISISIFVSRSKDRVMKLNNKYYYIVLFIILVEIITVFNGLIDGNVNPGALIQPIFLYSCLSLGYYISIKYHEDGCISLLKKFSYILCFAAIICVPEYITKKSIFFKSYGNSWDAFRTPSIFGHPILVGTSLTIALAIYIFIYKKSFVKYICIFLSLFGIFVCASRSSWLACAGIMFMTIFAIYRDKITYRKLYLGFLCILVFIIFLLSPVGRNVVDMILSRFQEATVGNVSRAQRTGALYYFWSVLIAEGNPISLLFGHGEDAAANIMLNTSIVFERFSTTDNEYLLIIYNYGMIFLIFLLLKIYKCIKLYISNYNKSLPVENCLRIICISQAICSFFYEITENKSCAFLLMCSIGMLLGLDSIRNQRNVSITKIVE